MKRLLILLVALLISTPLAAADWYVRSSCGNNGDGTAEACAGAPDGVGPWNSFANIVWGSINPGDTLYLVSGETYTDFMLITASGSSGSPILITVSGAGVATIDGEETRSRGFQISGSNSYITIDGVRGDALAGDFDYGIKIVNILGGAGGLYINSNPAGTDIKMLHVDISGTQTDFASDDQGGIRVTTDGTRYEFAFNWIHGLTADPPSARWSATGIEVWTVLDGTGYDGCLIHHNLIENLAQDGIKVSNNASIYNNIVRKVYESGNHSDAIQIQGGDHDKIYNNLVEDTLQQGIYLSNTFPTTKGDWWVYNNIVNAPGSSTAMPWQAKSDGPIDNIHVFNNLLWGSAAFVIRVLNTVTNVEFVNNILKQDTGSEKPLDLRADTTFLNDDALDNNIYVGYGSGDDIVHWTDGAGKTLAELQALSPAREVNGQLGTPDFVDSGSGDFHLTASDTLAKDQGRDLSSVFTTDLDGVARPQGSAWDIGPYEFVPAGATVSGSVKLSGAVKIQ